MSDPPTEYREEFERTLRGIRRTKMLFILAIVLLVAFILILIIWTFVIEPVRVPTVLALPLEHSRAFLTSATA